MKEFRFLSEEQKKIIIDMYYQNKSYEEIKSEYDCSIRCIQSVIKEANINAHLRTRYTLDENYFDNIDEERKAYWLGLLYADGALVAGHTVTITLKEEDSYLLEEFKKDLKLTKEVRHYISNAGFCENFKGATLSFASKNIYNNLRKIGLFRNKSLILNDIPNISPELIRHFIRGYFDGDGSIINSVSTSYFKKKKYTYKQKRFLMIGTEEFLLKVCNILDLKTFGINNSRTARMKYLTTSSKKQIEHIKNYFYKDSTIFMKRKKDIFFQ